MKKQKNKLGHRVLALALALMLCVGMLPMAAFAAEGGHTHNYGPVIKDDNGTECVKCRTCSTICYQIDGTGHKANATTVWPTCTEAGYMEYTCNECGYYEKVSGAEPQDHDWGEWKVEKEATYTESGVKKRVCSRDSSHIETQDIPKLTCEHRNEKVIEEQTATCTQDGYKIYKCYDCGRTDKVLESALGHELAFKWVDKEPTCTASGLAKYDCTRTNCNYSEVQVIPVKDHVCPDQLSWDNEQHWSECKVCHGVIGEKKAHEWTEVDRKPASCTEPGEIKLDCAADGCNASKVETIPATDHECGNFIWDDSQHWTVCKKCGEVIGEKKNHEWVEVDRKNPTCTENGWVKYDCNLPGCNASKDETLLAIGHDWDEGKYELGKIVYTCKNDSSHITTEPCFHTGGNHEDRDLHKEPTCTEKGQEVFVCNDCGAVVDNKEIAPLGHKGVWHVVNGATCTEKGNSTLSCEVCGAELDHSSTDPIGHDYKEYVSDEAEGHHQFCENDHSHVTETVAHTYSDWSDWSDWVDNGDGTRTQTHTHSCEACGYTETESVSEPIPTNPIVPIIPSDPSTSDPDEDDIPDPDVPLGPEPGDSTPTPAPTEEPTPGPSASPDPDEDNIPDPDVPLGPSPDDPTTDPDIDIEDPDVPLAPGPVVPDGEPAPAPTTKPAPAPDKDEEIPDEAVPMANTPKTGDDSGIWLTLALASAAGLVFLGISRRKKGQNVR